MLLTVVWRLPLERSHRSGFIGMQSGRKLDLFTAHNYMPTTFAKTNAGSLYQLQTITMWCTFTWNLLDTLQYWQHSWRIITHLSDSVRNLYLSRRIQFWMLLMNAFAILHLKSLHSQLTVTLHSLLERVERHILYSVVTKKFTKYLFFLRYLILEFFSCSTKKIGLRPAESTFPSIVIMEVLFSVAIAVTRHTNLPRYTSFTTTFPCATISYRLIHCQPLTILAPRSLHK